MVFPNRVGYGTADQIHLADQVDALFGLVIKFEYEAEHVTGINEANDNDVSRIGNRAGKDNSADTSLDGLAYGHFPGAVVPVCVPADRRQRPETAVVVFQDT